MPPLHIPLTVHTYLSTSHPQCCTSHPIHPHCCLTATLHPPLLPHTHTPHRTPHAILKTSWNTHVNYATNNTSPGFRLSQIIPPCWLSLHTPPLYPLFPFPSASSSSSSPNLYYSHNSFFIIILVRFFCQELFKVIISNSIIFRCWVYYVFPFFFFSLPETNPLSTFFNLFFRLSFFFYHPLRYFLRNINPIIISIIRYYFYERSPSRQTTGRYLKLFFQVHSFVYHSLDTFTMLFLKLRFQLAFYHHLPPQQDKLHDAI